VKIYLAKLLEEAYLKEGKGGPISPSPRERGWFVPNIFPEKGKELARDEKNYLFSMYLGGVFLSWGIGVGIGGVFFFFLVA